MNSGKRVDRGKERNAMKKNASKEESKRKSFEIWKVEEDVTGRKKRKRSGEYERGK